MQFVYSWMGSPLHLVLEEDIANGYNRFQEAFFQAQVNHKALNGSEWKPNEPLRIVFEYKDKAAWDAVGTLINLLIEINGGGLDIPEEQCTSDFLVKL